GGADEALRVFGHRHPNRGPGIAEPAHEFTGLVAGDPAAHAHQDALVLQVAGGLLHRFGIVLRRIRPTAYPKPRPCPAAPVPPDRRQWWRRNAAARLQRPRFSPDLTGLAAGRPPTVPHTCEGLQACASVTGPAANVRVKNSLPAARASSPTPNCWRSSWARATAARTRSPARASCWSSTARCARCSSAVRRSWPSSPGSGRRAPRG